MKFKIGYIWILIFALACQTNPREKESRVDTLPFYKDPSFTPHWLQPNSDSLNHFHQIPPFSLTNQKGKTITEKDMNGKITIVDFFFTTCPGICPRMTKNMAVVQQEFPKDEDILLLSHSVTPEQDSVMRLEEYALAKDVDPRNWHLLTGERSTIYDLGRNWYYVEEDLGKQKSDEDFLHTENFLLIDKNRHIRGIYNGLNKTSIEQLIADIETLKKE